jgi:hypothetical protein
MADDTPELFHALDVGRTFDTDGLLLPTVVIDASDSPAVADLARVHAVEGVGDIRTAAVRAGHLLVLGIAVTVPVRASFAIVVDVDRHRALIDDVIEHEVLVIAHSDPAVAGDEQPQWLAVDIDGAALSDCLAA